MLWNADLIEKYNLSGPRYTSYPTAPQFSDSVSKISLIEKMLAPSGKPLSLYFHIPFCAHLCYYCACNKIITKQYAKGDEYVDLLGEEMRLKSLMIDQERRVEQLHFGGGTPTFLSTAATSRLFSLIREHFLLLDNDQGDYSIEIDPREIDDEKLACLREVGFNRLSLGIQDFAPLVQKAVHRTQSVESVRHIMQQARKLGFRSINFDLIYGLPHQTLESFDETLQQVLDLNPDRLSVFNYAHLPQRFAPQRRINEADLPSPSDKLALLEHTIKTLTGAGYQYIGMDHFAKPEDTLSVAQQEGKLQRNFQGYTTHADCDLIAFGTSAISQIEGVYIQNHYELEPYQTYLERGQLPILKGYLSTEDDLIRHDVIMQLICNFELKSRQIEKKYNIRFASYFANEMARLIKLEEDGILTIESREELVIRVSESGRLLIRSICMIFDNYLNNVITYSKVI